MRATSTSPDGSYYYVAGAAALVGRLPCAPPAPLPMVLTTTWQALPLSSVAFHARHQHLSRWFLLLRGRRCRSRRSPSMRATSTSPDGSYYYVAGAAALVGRL